MTKTVIINGKFYRARLEGMPRVGREVTLAMDALLARGAADPLDLCLCVPPGTTGFEELTRIRVAETGKRDGFLWEQLDLPRFARGRPVLNFTSTGPLLLRKALTVVHDAQQYSTPQSFHWKNRILYRTVTPAVCRRHDRVLTVSEYARDQIAHYALRPADAIHVVHNAADHMLRVPADDRVLARLDLPRDGFLLCNSYVHAHKNVAVIFEALRAHPEIAHRLVLFGSSGRHDYEARGIAVPDGVRFTGRVSDGELRSLFAHASLFLFPSKTEGFGLPALEAMVLGCPTVVSRAGALPEICGNGALYADPARPEEWLQVIRSLLADPARQVALSRAGRARAAQFTWERAATRYLALLSELAA